MIHVSACAPIMYLTCSKCLAVGVIGRALVKGVPV